MPVTYDPAIIALSVVIAIQGGYVSLMLARRLASLGLGPDGWATAGRRKALLAASALALGIGIWAMHFIGMLAVKLPVAMNYDLLWTLVSALVCILVVGLGVFVASFGRLTPKRLAGAGLLMGAGIAMMHYVGMSALRANCIVSYSPALVAASFAVAVAASGLALWLAFSPTHKPHLMAGAACMGLAISGMHYTGMAAATFLPAEDLVAISAPVLSLDLLAIVVAVTAFVICGLFLLVLLPNGLDSKAEQREEETPKQKLTLVSSNEGREEEAMSPESAAASVRIPVNRNGTTRLLTPQEIYAVHADAHYTYVFDGQETHFCNLSISEIESRLDPQTFLRVHRSHIVNVAHAAALKRVRDQGLLELDSAERHQVPVSRSRLPKLRAALGI
ncbi:MHYT domain-containing protein [Pelagibius marinus]|uniref:MHYT domain-containing protein n=1 Tax=Pelagibius marinus TaxID=2762760 RepID=UPI001873138F|nr:MHYT domain-containing protein [Pelagibius marinus]